MRNFLIRLSDPEFRRTWLPSLFSVLAWLILYFSRLDTVPGLHGDEAWVGLRAHRILNERGFSPIFGMNHYTGSLHQWLVIPFLAVADWTVSSLRVFSLLANLGGAFLFWRLIRAFWGKEAANLSALLLVTAPFFLIYSRIAMEHHALNPLLALTALNLIFVGKPHSGKDIAAGVFMAAAIWNHAISATVPIALFCAVGVSRFASAPEKPPTAAVIRRCTDVLIGLLVPLISLWATTDVFIGQRIRIRDGFSGKETFGKGFLDAQITPLWDYLRVFVHCLNGGDLFLRFTGTQSAWAYLSGLPLLFVSAMARAVKAARKWRPPVLGDPNPAGPWAFFAVLTVSTILSSPRSADRYLLLPLYAAVALCAPLCRDLLRPAPGRKRFFGLFFGFVLVSGMLRTVWFYHGEHIRMKGAGQRFNLGNFVETSAHFVESHDLYALLAREEKRPLYGSPFVIWPLKFYDLNKNRLRFVDANSGGYPFPFVEIRHAEKAPGQAAEPGTDASVLQRFELIVWDRR